MEKWLDAKETEFMKKYKQMGYKLINVKKMKNL